jgi:tRNA pseudouridine32 synthase/23S rRNA pseudouridine746 synthase
VILAAKTKPAASFLGKAMMARKFAKTYRAIVTPAPPEPAEGLIEAPLRRDEAGREAFMRISAPDHPDAETARTRYRTLAAAPGAALMELDPETGRMHQLRVHLAHLGRPIAGDARYGGALVVAGQPVARLMLHAAKLSFPHPAGGTTTIAAPTPADMESLLQALALA